MSRSNHHQALLVQPRLDSPPRSVGGLMQLHRVENVEWAAAGDEHFTGVVWLGRMTPVEGSGVRVSAVRFEPGARSDWHSHQEGQILHCLHGAGRVGTGDGRVNQIGPGDLLHTPPGERHWHGAADDTSMVHLSFTAGSRVAWSSEKVTDEEYHLAG
jgi:quercetin dioxygenase-like cupin family protein